MSTPSKARGLVVGQKYRIGKLAGIDFNGSGALKVGVVAEFVQDDGSELPWFKAEGAYGRDCLDIKTATFTLEGCETPEVEKKATPFSVDVGASRTTLTVYRPLTLDEVKRILDIVGG